MKTTTFLKKQALWFALLVASSFSFAQVTVTTLAGSTQGYADGTGAAAKFYYPYGIAVDAGGNVYVADYGNHKIRKITPAGVVSTLAGSTQGYADGMGTTAQFNYPFGVAVDASGNVFVADYGNHKIRKIDPAGMVSTFAGGNQEFTYPAGVAVDAFGNVYVADTFSNKIKKITSAGLVTTLAGSTAGYADGAGTAAQFYYPYGVAIDVSGNVYVADYGNNKIRKMTAVGVVTTLAGSTQGYADGTGTTAQFNYPTGVVVDASGTVYVADTLNHKIRKITGDFLSTASHNSLKDLKAYPNPSNGIFVIQTDGNAIVEVFDPTGKQILSQKINGQNATIDLSQYPAGIYLAKVTADNKLSKTIKLIKL